MSLPVLPELLMDRRRSMLLMLQAIWRSMFKAMCVCDDVRCFMYIALTLDSGSHF